MAMSHGVFKALSSSAAHSVGGALEATDGVGLDEIEIDLVANELADIVNVILDHRRPTRALARSLTRTCTARAGEGDAPLERQAPGNDTHIRRQTHRQEHLWTEHALHRTMREGGGREGGKEGGRTELPISTQRLRAGWKPKISMEGSV